MQRCAIDPLVADERCFLRCPVEPVESAVEDLTAREQKLTRRSTGLKDHQLITERDHLNGSVEHDAKSRCQSL